MKLSLKELDFAKGNGLIPVIVQDVQSKEVLMMAYTNVKALQKTQKTGLAHFWSRSRKSLWLKGDTSGHYQKVKKITVDCDQDALIFFVESMGPACHTGNRTCFYRELAKEKVV